MTYSDLVPGDVILHHYTPVGGSSLIYSVVTDVNGSQITFDDLLVLGDCSEDYDYTITFPEPVFELIDLVFHHTSAKEQLLALHPELAI